MAGLVIPQGLQHLQVLPLALGGRAVRLEQTTLPPRERHEVPRRSSR